MFKEDVSSVFTELCRQSDVHEGNGRNGSAPVAVREHRGQLLDDDVVLDKTGQTGLDTEVGSG